MRSQSHALWLTPPYNPRRDRDNVQLHRIIRPAPPLQLHVGILAILVGQKAHAYDQVWPAFPASQKNCEWAFSSALRLTSNTTGGRPVLYTLSYQSGHGAA